MAAGITTVLAGATYAQEALPETFAGCVGRMSAEMEHAWLMARDNADRIADERASFLALLDAVAPQEQKHSLLMYRIETKMAHAALLTTAHFSENMRYAERAKQVARRHLDACRHLLLGA